MKYLEVMRKAIAPVLQDAAVPVRIAGKKSTSSPTISYNRRSRSQWFRPEYDFNKLQIAQHTEPIILRTIKKKKDRLQLAGFEFVGPTEEPVTYIRNRIAQMEYVSNRPFALLVAETAEDLERQNNSMWVKIRNSDSSSGQVRVDINGSTLEPVAAYYLVQFEQLEFKTKANGELKKIKQVSQDREVQWDPHEVIHFFQDRKPGFLVGTPALLPALDDAALLRRIEEQIEELIETNLFPAYHYQVGTDEYPERVAPSGELESEIVKKKIEYMEAGSILVSDHRHKINALGAEGKALSIEKYLEYFKKRLIASAGATEVDLGIAGDSNRSTANTLSKSMLMDIKALQNTLKLFIDFYVIKELLLEGGYDLFDPANNVEIKFGEIDLEAQLAMENQQIQMFVNNVRNLNEIRAVIGDRPVNSQDEKWFNETFYKLFQEPLTFAKSAGMPESPAGDVLAQHPASNVSPEAVGKAKAMAKQLNKPASQPGTRSKSAKSTTANKSASRARPSNQHGTRSSAKLTKDVRLQEGDATATISVDMELSSDVIEDWKQLVIDRYQLVRASSVQLQTVANSLLYRLKDE